MNPNSHAKITDRISEKQTGASRSSEQQDSLRLLAFDKSLQANIISLANTGKILITNAAACELLGYSEQDLLTKSRSDTRNAIEEIRKLTKGLTTDTINNLGLQEAIDNMIRDTMEVNDIKIPCSLIGFKEEKINNKFKLNVYRIVQEQLKNILKHSKSTKVNILLVQNRKSIILGISDNGIGFDTNKKQNGVGEEISRAGLQRFMVMRILTLNPDRAVY